MGVMWQPRYHVESSACLLPQWATGQLKAAMTLFKMVGYFQRRVSRKTWDYCDNMSQRCPFSSSVIFFYDVIIFHSYVIIVQTWNAQAIRLRCETNDINQTDKKKEKKKGFIWFMYCRCAPCQERKEEQANKKINKQTNKQINKCIKNYTAMIRSPCQDLPSNTWFTSLKIVVPSGRTAKLQRVIKLQTNIRVYNNNNIIIYNNS